MKPRKPAQTRLAFFIALFIRALGSAYGKDAKEGAEQAQ